MTLQSHSWAYIQRKKNDPKGDTDSHVHWSTVYNSQDMEGT